VIGPGPALQHQALATSRSSAALNGLRSKRTRNKASRETTWPRKRYAGIAGAEIGKSRLLRAGRTDAECPAEAIERAGR